MPIVCSWPDFLIRGSEKTFVKEKTNDYFIEEIDLFFLLMILDSNEWRILVLSF